MTRPLLGVIADDFTGATDAASMLARAGLGVSVLIGVPPPDLRLPQSTDALVVALKSRTVPAAQAVADSLLALKWLERQGCLRFYFKYCSTFDSTPQGNIGPVADALLSALGESFTVVSPALPVNGRTVYQGHLFVGGQLLSDSPLRDHPLTPMTDSNLCRVLARQTARPVGLIAHHQIEEGTLALRTQLGQLHTAGYGYAVVDALDDAHLATLAHAATDLRLLTGSSGLIRMLGEAYRVQGLVTVGSRAAPLRHTVTRSLVLAGSCSASTRQQVARFAARHPALSVDPLALAEDADAVLADVLAWLEQQPVHESVMVFSSAPPEEVQRVQQLLGADQAAALTEHLLASVALKASEHLGFNTLVVAGGETSGAVVQALGIQALEVGPEIDPGVPWTLTLSGPSLALALKSGNFGASDFFEKALRTWL